MSPDNQNQNNDQYQELTDAEVDLEFDRALGVKPKRMREAQAGIGRTTARLAEITRQRAEALATPEPDETFLTLLREEEKTATAQLADYQRAYESRN